MCIFECKIVKSEIIQKPKDNMRKTIILYTLLLALFSCQTQPQKEKDQATKPNIIYILADDLGYGDLSFLGQTKFQTPNIDQLAKQGMTFTQHYAGSTVCSPSRSTLLTGQHTGHTPIRGNKGYKDKGNWPLPAESVTVAEILKQNGYVTGAFGKWGLGYPGSTGDPKNKGFDEFFGYNHQSLAHNYYPAYLNHNQDTVWLTNNDNKGTGTYAPTPIHAHALKFMEDNKDKPFFMFYPSVIPHAELFAPEKYMEKYRGKFLPEKEYKGVDEGPKYRKGPYGSQRESHAAFAAMINLLDDQVGEIVAKLKELGIEDNTIIIFSSDNGPHLEGGADPDYFDSNGIYKGYKRDLYEGGIHVPMIVCWPGKVKAESTSNHVSAFWDFLPTVTEIIGAETPDNIDGISFLPSLLGKDKQQQHDYLYWEFHEKQGRVAIRQGDWKLIRYNVFDPENTTTELYNLITDPGEENNVALEYPEILNELVELIQTARTESEIYSFQSKTVVK